MLIVLRGLPGSGKTRHVAKSQFSNKVVASADLWFETTKTEWAGKHLEEAHAWAQEQARKGLELPDDAVVVFADNTHSRLWEYRPYIEMAEAAGHTVEIVDLFDGGETVEYLALRNVHNVPHSKVVQMADRWETAGRRLHDHAWRLGLLGWAQRGMLPAIIGGPTVIRDGGVPVAIETCGSLFAARNNLAKFQLDISRGEFNEDEWNIFDYSELMAVQALWKGLGMTFEEIQSLAFSAFREGYETALREVAGSIEDIHEGGRSAEDWRESITLKFIERKLGGGDGPAEVPEV